MAKQVKCSCGKMAEMRISKGKHQIPYLVCQECGPIMGRKRTYIERIRREAVDVGEPEQNQAAESENNQLSGAGQQSDSGGQTEGRKSIFNGWGTVL